MIKQLAQDCPNLETLSIRNATKIDACIPLLGNFKALNTLKLQKTDVTGSKLSELPKSIKKIYFIECAKLETADILTLATMHLQKLCVCGCPGVSADFIDGPKQNDSYQGIRAMHVAQIPTFRKRAPLTGIFYRASMFRPTKETRETCYQTVKIEWIDEEEDPDYEPPQHLVKKAVLTNALDFFAPPTL